MKTLGRIIVLLVALTIFLNREAVAQSSAPPATNSTATGAKSTVPKDATQQMAQLVSDLKAKGDTNTLEQVTRLLTAKDMVTWTRDAGVALVLLETLRAGQTNQAISILETQLDSGLAGIGSSPQQVGEAQIKILGMAKKYRAKYPRKSGEAVTRAFESLEPRRVKEK